MTGIKKQNDALRRQEIVPTIKLMPSHIFSVQNLKSADPNCRIMLKENRYKDTHKDLAKVFQSPPSHSHILEHNQYACSLPAIT